MTMLEGYDVSSHQSHTPSLTGKSFLIARATYGAHGDDMYFVHQRNTRNAGKVFGAFHFARPTTTGDTVGEQVNAFLLMAKEADIIAIDVEEDVWIDNSGVRRSNGTMTRADVRAFISAVHKRGRRIGLYISESHWFDAGQDFDWIANWAHQPTRSWDIWQYNGGGTDHLDNDRFDGTITGLKALGLPSLPDTSTEPPAVIQPDPIIITVLPFGGRFAIPPNATITGFKLDGPNWTIGTTKKVTADADGSSADYDATMVNGNIKGNPFIRVSTGVLAGFYVTTAAVVETLNPAPTADCTELEKTVAAQDAIIAAQKTQLANDQAALDKAAADLADASAKERERIATASGSAEASRIRNL